MKKVMISLVTVIFAVVSMSFMLNNDETDAALSKNSCTITVTNSSGNGISGVRVVGSVCGGISCIGNTKAVNTNSDGEATIYWSDGCKLCAVYVDGKEHSGTYKDGGSYTIKK